MALRGFKPSVALTDDWANAQITDSATKRSLKLTGTEARVLQLFDGTQSPEELALAARAEGLTLDPPQAGVLLERLRKAGFLAAPAPAVKPALQRDAGQPLQATDRVPCMREDLNIAPTPGSRGTLQVTDPKAGRSFTLYDFEVSIARMLNGRRTAQEVIGAATRIGIPVNLESLEKFLRQLRAYHFLLEGEAAELRRGEGTTWPSRSVWTPEVRELYQSALRMHRSARPKEALDYLYALLQIDPSNDEALATKARIEEQLADDVAVDITFEELHGDAPVPSNDELPPEDQVPLGGEPPAYGEASAVMPVASRLREKRVPLLVGGGVLLLVVLFFPVARVRYVPGELSPVTVAKVTAPRAGKVGRLVVGEGQVVAKGDALLELVDDQHEAERVKLVDRAKELDLQADLTQAKVKPAAATHATMVVDAKTRELEKAVEALKKLDQAKKKPPRALKVKLERVVAAKQAALAKAKAELDAVTFEAKLKANRAEADKVKRQLEQLAAASATPVAAPAAGKVRGLAQAGAAVEQGGELATLVAPQRLTVRAKDPSLPNGANVAKATLSADGTPVDSVHWEGGALVGTVAPVPASVAAGPTALEVRLSRKPWLFTLF